MSQVNIPSRWLAAVGFIVFTAASADTTWAQDEALAGRPKFASSSDGPVSLRYQFKAGQNFDMATEVHADMVMSGGPINVTMNMKMAMAGEFTVESVDEEGNARVVTKITRLTLETVGGPVEMRFDSDKPDEATVPQLRAVGAMVGAAIPAKISPTGKLLETDLSALKKAVQGSGGGAIMENAQQSADEMMRGSFIPFPADPVKIGDTYEAGEIAKAIPNQGIVKAGIAYKVLDVSADQKQVLLQPTAELTLDPSENAAMDVKLEKGSMDGWIHYDADVGTVVASHVVVKVLSSMTFGEQSTAVNFDMKIDYKATPKAEPTPKEEPTPKAEPAPKEEPTPKEEPATEEEAPAKDEPTAKERPTPKE